MIALDTKGSLAVGVSTNGLNYMLPGRVGDSPIPGAGGYADSQVSSKCVDNAQIALIVQENTHIYC